MRQLHGHCLLIEVSECETSEQELLSFALLASDGLRTLPGQRLSSAVGAVLSIVCSLLPLNAALPTVVPVSFTFDTIGLVARSCAGFLPYHTTLCTNQIQMAFFACLADAANQIVLDVVCLQSCGRRTGTQQVF